MSNEVVIFLFILSGVPLFLYLVDGYYKKNIKRGVLQISAFVITGICFSVIYGIWGWSTFLYAPFAILIFVLVFTKEKRS
jgi:hypothetical protein